MNRFYFSERVWLQTALLMLAAIPATMIASHFDGRTINDIAIWVKPLKFYISGAVHLITLAVLVRFLSEHVRAAAWVGVLAVLSAGGLLLDIVLISGQAARGVASHFNASTPQDVIIYALMGIGAILLILPALFLGIRFLIAQTSERLSPGLKLGAGLGLLLGFILTFVMAGYMSSQPSGHWVGAPRTDIGGIPVLGWSREGGDLRVSHFFATHMMQALPLFGYAVDKLFGRNSAMPKILVWIAALLGSGLAIATFLQAIAGEPFIR